MAITCDDKELNTSDLLREVMVMDDVTGNVAINVAYVAGETSFFDCIRKGFNLVDALRLAIVNVSGTWAINFNE